MHVNVMSTFLIMRNTQQDTFSDYWQSCCWFSVEWSEVGSIAQQFHGSLNAVKANSCCAVAILSQPSSIRKITVFILYRFVL